MNKQELLNTAFKILEESRTMPLSSAAIHAYVARANGYINLANAMDGIKPRRVK